MNRVIGRITRRALRDQRVYYEGLPKIAESNVSKLVVCYYVAISIFAHAKVDETIVDFANK